MMKLGDCVVVVEGAATDEVAAAVFFEFDPPRTNQGEEIGFTLDALDFSFRVFVA